MKDTMKVLLAIFAIAQLPAVEPIFLGVDYRESDKQGHFWLGAATSGVAILGLEKLDPDARWYTKAAVGMAASAAVGAIKEWRDSGDLTHHTVDSKDFLATATGGATVALTLCWKF